ncbi:MAG: DUF5666 domain-containing protein [Dehalococcoidia bacterium]
MTYDDALERALSLRSDAPALDAFLRGQPEWRPQLEVDLALAARSRAAINAAEPGAEASTRAEQQLLRLVGVLEARQAESQRLVEARRPGRGWWPRLGLMAAGVAALVLLAVILTQPGGGGIAPSTAEAVVIEGSVSQVTGTELTIVTPEGPRTFTLNGTILQDGFGNTIDLSELQPGQIVILTARPSDGTLVPQRLEVKDRIFGSLIAVSADRIVVQTSASQYAVRLAAETEVEGRLVPGVYVEVDVDRLDDGSFVADKVEVEDHDDDDGNTGPGSSDDDDDDNNSGPDGGGDDSDNSGPGSRR